MSAETLRRAAALMRERAEAATEGPWSVTHIPESAVANQNIIERWFVMGCFDGNPRNPTGPAALSEYEPDAAHIASWHPAVAPAVADWLDSLARRSRLLTLAPVPNSKEWQHGLAVARAYLGSES